MTLALSEPPRTSGRVSRTRGRRHGPITRLMSPGDLGGVLKPFVFLDLFDFDARSAGGMPLHPHSGIATVTVLVDGELRFDDPVNGRGTIGYGGVEWMRAGGGVWHGKEMVAGDAPRIRGFQLWLALPQALENGSVDSQYVEASAMPTVGPATVILGSFGGVSSPVRAPAGLNYLLVTLAPGERWAYALPQAHAQHWLALADGALTANGHAVAAGEMAVLRDAAAATAFEAGPDGAVFVVGSAVPHPHELVLGSYSVHTTLQALEQGEARIEALGQRVRLAGLHARPGPLPPFSG